MEKLNKISDTMAGHMSTEVSKGTNDANTPLEAALKLKGHSRPQQTPRVPTPQDKPPVVQVGEFVVYNDPTTLLFAYLIQLNNSEVDGLLTQFQFQMMDIHSKPMFPRVSPAVTPPTVGV